MALMPNNIQLWKDRYKQAMQEMKPIIMGMGLYIQSWDDRMRMIGIIQKSVLLMKHKQLMGTHILFTIQDLEEIIKLLHSHRLKFQEEIDRVRAIGNLPPALYALINPSDADVVTLGGLLPTPNYAPTPSHTQSGSSPLVRPVKPKRVTPPPRVSAPIPREEICTSEDAQGLLAESFKKNEEQATISQSQGQSSQDLDLDAWLSQIVAGSSDPGPSTLLTDRGARIPTEADSPIEGAGIEFFDFTPYFDADSTTVESVAGIYTAADTQQRLELTLEELMRSHAPSDLSSLVTIPARSYAHGGLADVYAGTFDNVQVAVKVLRIRKSRRAGARDREASNERRIRREMHVWSALKHRNICEFLGYSTDLSDYPAMISTWCEHGTATEYLEGRTLSIKERIRLAQDVGDGLGYLHRLKVVHGDLKPNNVLVDGEGSAKLCDFGLVRLLDWEGPAGMTTTSPYTGTERYKAPELFISSENRHPVATLEGDVYSMGCIMLEFIEGVYPFQRFRQTYELRNAIQDGYAPSLRRETTGALRQETTGSSFDLTDYFWDLLEACWGEYSARPSAAVIINTLDALAREVPQGNTQRR